MRVPFQFLTDRVVSKKLLKSKIKAIPNYKARIMDSSQNTSKFIDPKTKAKFKKYRCKSRDIDVDLYLKGLSKNELYNVYKAAELVIW